MENPTACRCEQQKQASNRRRAGGPITAIEVPDVFETGAFLFSVDWLAEEASEF
jgi:hypothetical protein